MHGEVDRVSSTFIIIFITIQYIKIKMKLTHIIKTNLKSDNWFIIIIIIVASFSYNAIHLIYFFVCVYIYFFDFFDFVTDQKYEKIQSI